MDLTYVLGDFGTVQKRVFFFCFLRTFTLVSFVYLVRFYSVVPEHWCAPPDSIANVTNSEWKHYYLPKTEKGFSRCQHYQLDEEGIALNSTLVNCDTWNYGSTNLHESFVIEWNLVCDRRWHVSLLYTLFSAGALLSYGPSGYLTDRYGRRRCLLIGVILTLSTSLGFVLSSSIHAFLVMQFFAGLSYPFLQHVPLTLFTELVGTKQRNNYVSLFFTAIWGSVIVLYAGFSMIIPTWRYFIIVGVIPTQLVMLISIFTIIPESPRWLLSVKKYSRAEEEIKKLASINGISIINENSVMESLKEKIEGHGNKEGSKSEKGFFHSKRLVAYAALLFTISLLLGFAQFGSNISLAHIGGHPKMNYFINGFIGIVSGLMYEIAKPFMKFRRIVIVSGFGIAGIAYMATTLVPYHLHWVKLTLALSGNLFQNVSNALLYILATELFPTHLRGKGIALRMTCTRIGHVLGAFSDYFVYKYGHNSVLLFFGGIFILVCLGVFVLPQTEDKHLADSVAEAKLITKTEVKQLPETKL